MGSFSILQGLTACFACGGGGIRWYTLFLTLIPPHCTTATPKPFYFTAQAIAALWHHPTQCRTNSPGLYGRVPRVVGQWRRALAARGARDKVMVSSHSSHLGKMMIPGCTAPSKIKSLVTYLSVASLSNCLVEDEALQTQTFFMGCCPFCRSWFVFCSGWYVVCWGRYMDCTGQKIFLSVDWCCPTNS